MKRIYLRPAGIILSMLFVAYLLNGCKKNDIAPPAINENTDVLSGSRIMKTDEEFRKNHSRLSWQTLLELFKVRYATAKYRNIQNALDDQYHDIGVKVENMGHHYMKDTLVDGKFELTKPEIVVYNKLEDGSFELVAVEYAVPISETPYKAPKGFTGHADKWDKNLDFKLWLLHAWVWHKNPDGVFNPTNPLIHTH